MKWSFREIWGIDMKVNSFVSIALLCFAFGCTATKNSSSLFSEYESYLRDVNRENLSKVYSGYFSPALLEGESIHNLDVVDQLMFKNYMDRMDSHFQSKGNSVGCLSVNGFDLENMPVTFRLRYSKPTNWLIEEVQVRFVNSITDFDRSAKCPEAAT
ncbi:Uncharacterised protein [BD1-7 clade bacterium]|uniref:DUF3828 domain-containing protein n=1 Tax=BD1-7 clade bacterium TaxID=2029982 RepID=A0A5S9QJ03_9GAMM|nr:Uncharacterised protein [BD1-7 clade bacterium]